METHQNETGLFRCAFTGHRPKSLPYKYDESDGRCIALKELLFRRVSQLYERGVREFFCGMALGCDTFFAEAVIRLKSVHSDLRLIACIPAEQTKFWKDDSVARYDTIIKECDDVVDFGQVTPVIRSIFARNEYMVDNCDILICCILDSEMSGGTARTLRYAQKKNRMILKIDPASLKEEYVKLGE